jgi:sodium/hydrogen exchanger-like protein 3
VALWGVGQTGLYGEHDTPGILETFLFSSLISAVDPVAVLAVFEEIQVINRGHCKDDIQSRNFSIWK